MPDRRGVERVLALDVGDVRIGVARSDELGITAQPAGVLRRTELAEDLRKIATLVREHQAERIVVGLPLRMDGTDSPQTVKVREFARDLAAAVPVPVELSDERLTTAEAEDVLRQMGVRRRRRKQVVDMMAAQIILRDWMEEQKKQS